MSVLGRRGTALVKGSDLDLSSANPHGEVIDWRDEADPEQTRIVVEIVDRLLARDPIKAITADLNTRQVPGPRRGNWRPSRVRKIALRPANVALRVHHGQVIGPAAWPPIVDRDRHDPVAALLRDPARATSRSGARKHLLTYGVGECGRCRAVLRVVTRGGHELYVCDGPRGCVGRHRQWVDDLVGMVIVERLSRPDAWDLFVGDDDAAAELAGPEAAARWDALSVPQRCAVVEVFGLRVRLLPGMRGGPGFRPESVAIEWGGS